MLGAEAPFFPVSVWYAGGKARAPMLEPVTLESRQVWREDLRKIKNLGFNTVRCWIEWTSCEPRPGEFHFEQMELILDLAQEVGLKVLVQVYVDSAPDWVGEKFPDGLFVAQNGAAIPSQAAPGYCFDHAGVRKAVLDFYQEATRRARKSPSFYGWDLWSEPHVINWAIIEYIPNATFCYCPHTLNRFRKWLQDKYRTLDHLNRAWYRTFRDWNQVEPPRFGTILSYTDYIDWRLFITEKLAEDLKMRHQAVKQIDPEHVTTSHSAVPSVFTNPAAGDGTPDDFLMNFSVDYWGTSFYPKHSFPSSHWSLARRALAMDFVRAVTGEKGFYVGELQGGFGTRGVVVGEEITAQDLALYTWGMVARGARAINFYAFYPMSSGYESGGYGLINLDGSLTERSRKAGEIAKVIAANADLILQSRPQRAEAAILFNRLATLVGGEQNSGNRGALRDSTAGYHRMFFERNIPLDFLSAGIVRPEQLSAYKLIILPYPILLTEHMAGMLEQYVSRGGHLFVEARAGWNDERGYAQPVIPGFQWHKLFGVREKSVTPRAEFPLRWGKTSFSAAALEERFEILDKSAEPLAFFEDGSPAAFERKHGKGSAIVLGGFAGLLNEAKPVSNHPLGDILARWAGLTLPDLKFSAPVEFRQLSAAAGKLILLFNHGKEPVTVDAGIELEKPAARIRDLIVDRSMDQKESTRKLRLRVEIPPQSVRVYRVDY
ncbi:MAG TPA: beta-galactosidase [Acidobacteriota bacterium]|jgi:beta-galactosidase